MSIVEQLKGKLPFPFETIAVAINFSPRYRSVIKEAARIAYLYKSKLILIHIGTLEADQRKKISDCVLDCHINEANFKIIYQQGSVVSTILSVCKENVVDLLILGALKKEVGQAEMVLQLFMHG